MLCGGILNILIQILLQMKSKKIFSLLKLRRCEKYKKARRTKSFSIINQYSRNVRAFVGKRGDTTPDGLQNHAWAA